MKAAKGWYDPGEDLPWLLPTPQEKGLYDRMQLNLLTPRFPVTPNLEQLIDQNRDAYLAWFASLTQSPTLIECAEFFRSLDPDLEVDWDEVHPIIVTNWFEETF